MTGLPSDQLGYVQQDSDPPAVPGRDRAAAAAPLAPGALLLLHNGSHVRLAQFALFSLTFGASGGGLEGSSAGHEAAAVTFA